MELFDVEARERDMIGTSEVRKIKREGLVPGILYQGDESKPILFKEEEIRNILNKHGRDVILNVNYNGKKIKSKIQEVQRKPINDEIIHLDLMPLDKDITNTH
ncbi:UNVERIFIED_CONTAM: large subunit ribosomal protein L25 [Acetivibrio alkalicellulosi]